MSALTVFGVGLWTGAPTYAVQHTSNLGVGVGVSLGCSVHVDRGTTSHVPGVKLGCSERITPPVVTIETLTPDPRIDEAVAADTLDIDDHSVSKPVSDQGAEEPQPSFTVAVINF